MHDSSVSSAITLSSLRFVLTPATTEMPPLSHLNSTQSEFLDRFVMGYMHTSGEEDQKQCLQHIWRIFEERYPLTHHGTTREAGIARRKDKIRKVGISVLYRSDGHLIAKPGSRK